jgi:aspartate kinase
MHGVTNYLIDLVRSVHDSADHREYDAVISSGEQIAAGLLAARLCAMRFPAVSLNCYQIPIHAAGNFSNANITSIDISKINDLINDNIIPVITGFQGVSGDHDIMTTGRGGSDSTACSIAYVIKADECLIYTDVDGIYTADPRIVLKANRLDEISYEEMLDLAYCGAEVLQPQSVLIAMRCHVKIRVLSSFTDTGGTIVTNKVPIPNARKVTGIAHNTNLAKIVISEIDLACATLLEKIGQIDLLAIEDNTISFLFQKSRLNEVKAILKDSEKYKLLSDIGLVTIVGYGFKADQSTFLEVMDVLKRMQLHPKQISVTETTISIVISLHQIDEVVNTLHSEFFNFDAQ